MRAPRGGRSCSMARWPRSSMRQQVRRAPGPHRCAHLVAAGDRSGGARRVSRGGGGHRPHQHLPRRGACARRGRARFVPGGGAPRARRRRRMVAAYAERPRTVAGALGPAEPQPEPGRDRQATAERFREAFRAPLIGLLEGGVDVLLFETWWSPSQTEGALARVRRRLRRIRPARAGPRLDLAGARRARGSVGSHPRGVARRDRSGDGRRRRPELREGPAGSRPRSPPRVPAVAGLVRPERGALQRRRNCARPRAVRPGRGGERGGGPRPHCRRLLRHHAGAHPRAGERQSRRQMPLRRRAAPGHNERRRASPLDRLPTEIDWNT